MTELASYGEHRPDKPLAEDRWSTFGPNDGYCSTGYAPFRQMQSEFATLPDTGCAPNFDLGEQYDIHPKRKRPIAKRLVAEALRLSYGETEREPAPRFRSATRDGSSVLVSFDFTGKGLEADGGAFNRVPDEASFVVNLRGISADSADRAEAFIRETTGSVPLPCS